MTGLGGDQGAFWMAFWSAFHALLDDGDLPAFVVSRDGCTRLNPGLAIAFAAEVYGVQVNDLLGRLRERDLIDARCLTVWGMRHIGGRWSCHAIGRALGGRDHSTISHLSTRANALFERSPRFAGACEDMRRHFTQATEIAS